MKKLLSVFIAAGLIFTLSTCGRKEPEPEPDYMAMMLNAVCTGDVDAGIMAQNLLCESRQMQNEEGCMVCFEELYRLSRAIHCRFGGGHFSDELRLCMGELLLNRLAAEAYPDTLEEVIENAAGEGILDLDSYISCVKPDYNSASVALRLLLGERMMESSVVDMSSERREGVYSTYCSTIWGNTYFYKGETSEQVQ